MKRKEDKTLEMTFSKNLRSKMDEFGVSTEDLEQDGVVAGSSVRKYLEGEVLPTLRTCYRIAEYFCCSVDWLCGMSDLDEDADYIRQNTNAMQREYDKKREEFYSALDAMSSVDDSEAPWGRLNV